MKAENARLRSQVADLQTQLAANGAAGPQAAPTAFPNSAVPLAVVSSVPPTHTPEGQQPGAQPLQCFLAPSQPQLQFPSVSRLGEGQPVDKPEDIVIPQPLPAEPVGNEEGFTDAVEVPACPAKKIGVSAYSYSVAGGMHSKEEIGACMLCLEPLQNDPREVVNLCSNDPRCLCLLHRRCYLNPQYEMSDQLRRCMICKKMADPALVRLAVKARQSR